MPSHSPTHAASRDLLIDEALPTYDVTQRRHAVVDATPDAAYDALLKLDLTRLGFWPRLLGDVRMVPETLASSLRGEAPQASPSTMTFADVRAQPGWMVLGERPGDEYVIGAVGRFWRAEIEWLDVAPEAFADFDRPGYAKLAIGLSVRPYGSDRSLVTYEARTATTDAASRRRFEWYWTLIGPFAGYLMGRVLATLQRQFAGRGIEGR